MSVERNKLSKNILSLGVVQIANYILPLISVPIISRIIGPEKFGLIDFMASFITYFTLLIGFGFDFSATRIISQNTGDKEIINSTFSKVFYCQIILFVISLGIFILCLSFMPQLQSQKMLAAFTFTICIATLLTQNWLYQAMQDLQLVAIFNLLSKIIFIITLLLVVRNKEDYIWQPLILGGVQIVISIGSFCYAIKRYKIAFTKFSLIECFKLLKSESIIFFSIVVVNLYTTTNVVILGFYHKGAETAFFTSGQKLIIIAQSILVMPLMQALYPYIGKAFAEDHRTGLESAKKFLPGIIILTATAGFGMYLLGPLFISLFYGPAFLPSASVFQIMVFIPMLVAINYFLGINIMLNLKMDRIYFIITASAALVSVLLNFILIPDMGAQGSAIIWVLTELIISFLMYFVLLSKNVNMFDLRYWRFSFLKGFLGNFKQH